MFATLIVERANLGYMILTLIKENTSSERFIRLIRLALLISVLSIPHSLLANEPADVTAILKQAYQIRSADPQRSALLLDTLSRDALNMAQQDRYDRIRAYLLFMNGKVSESLDAFNALSQNAHTKTEKFSAYAALTALNAGIQNWSESFKALDYLLENIDSIDSVEAEEQAHTAAINLYSMINEDQVLLSYAIPLLSREYSPRFNCITTMHISTSKLDTDISSLSEEHFKNGLAVCEKAQEPVVALGIYTKYANYLFQIGQTERALEMLMEKLDQVVASNYAPLLDDYYVLLSQSYFARQDYTRAKEYALLVVGEDKQSMLVSQADVLAYEVLYQSAEDLGDYQQALELHKKYANAKSLNITNDNAKMLNIQKARQDSIEKTNEIALLNAENSLLRARSELDTETAAKRKLLISFMIIAFLVTCIWVYKKRSNYIKFREISRKDGLTGIANRHYFTTTSVEIVESCRKTNLPISLILFDLDDFKSINDSYGHQIGDKALQTAVDAAREACRDDDLIGRLGGEEFGITLRGCDINSAMAVAEDCRKAIENTNVFEGQVYHLSASFGVASSDACGYSFDSLFEASDKALYASKDAGKNKVSH